MTPDIDDIMLGDNTDNTMKAIRDAITGKVAKPVIPPMVSLPAKAGKSKKKVASAEPGVVDWKKIRGHATPDSVDDWENKDFFRYVDDRYCSKSKIRMAVKKAAGSLAITQIKKLIKQATGEACSNKRLKAYIDWFFENQYDSIMAKTGDGEFQIGMLKWARLIQSFALECPTPTAPVAETVEVPPASERIFPVAEFMEIAELGLQALLRSFGVVLAVNYLVSQGKSVNEAVTAVQSAAIQDVKRDRRFWENIVLATEKYNPYPKSLAWTSVETIVSAIAASVGGQPRNITLELCDQNASLGFMRNV